MHRNSALVLDLFIFLGWPYEEGDLHQAMRRKSYADDLDYGFVQNGGYPTLVIVIYWKKLGNVGYIIVWSNISLYSIDLLARQGLVNYIIESLHSGTPT